MKFVFLAVALVTVLAWRPADSVSIQKNTGNVEELSEIRQSRIRRDTLTCAAGQTKIYTPYIYDYNATNSQYCANVVGKLPYDYYNTDFKKECQRWLGLSSLPSQVGLSEPVYCYQWTANNTAVYQMAVCCEGTTSDVRCFTRTDPVESDNYGTNYHGSIQSCSADQLCETQYTFQGTACTVGKRIVTKGCVPASNCLTAASSPLCTDYATNPVCTTCCNSTFCNYKIDETLVKLPGQCSSSNSTAPTACSPNPCTYGYCSRVSNGISCSCRIGWTGTYCNQQRPLCTVNRCQNGGTCFDYGNGDYRCYCPAGFIGDDCEYSSILTCRRGDRAFYETPTETLLASTCDDLASTVQQQSPAYLPICIAQMQRPGGPLFVNGVNGQVDYITQFEPEYCRHGDTYSWYKLQMCCPACLSVPCQNGGRCIDVTRTNSYICACPAGFTGTNCEHPVTSSVAWN